MADTNGAHQQTMVEWLRKCHGNGIARSSGTCGVDSNERRWTMTPNEPWRPGDYALIALGVLEDLAGNRIGRPFEVVSKDDKGEDDAAINAVAFSLLPPAR